MLKKTLLKVLVPTVFVIASVSSAELRAQNAQAQAVQLIREAMTAYGNLDLDKSKQLLDQAVALSSQLPAAQVGRIFVSYGVLFSGGYGDNARGQEAFTIARCVDPTIQIDPVYSTPDVDMVFRMASAQVTPANCQQLMKSRGVTYSTGTPQPTPQPQPMPQPQPQPQPVPQVPVQTMGPAGVPECGTHTPLTQQRDSMEVPLFVHLNPQAAPHIQKIIAKYAFDGNDQYDELELTKGGDNLASALITCDTGNIQIFNPSAINYYIEGYDASGRLICGHGAPAQPFTISMTPTSPIVTGAPGMPAPRVCKECPPWDQDCLAAAGKPIPCFADDECPDGRACGDDGVCEGGDDPQSDTRSRAAGSGDVPRIFYANITIGSGGGFFSDPKNGQVKTDAINGVPYGYWKDGKKGGGWGGLGLRATAGFNLIPDFALELGFRFDLQSAFMKQTDVYWQECFQNGAGSSVGNATCYDGANVENASIPIAGFEQDGNTYLLSYKTKSTDAWMLALRGRYRFVNDGPMQMSLFLGAGYGHLFFAPKSTDIDFDGKTDRIISTPGMVVVDLGPGFSYYINRHLGIVLELPVTLAFGENGAFGLNAELSLGISFGG